MNENPYRATLAGSPENEIGREISADQCPACPECGGTMEAGYIASSASLFWRKWNNLNWLLRHKESLSKTSSVFGINRLSGFHCPRCEIVLFAYGENRKRFSPDFRQES